MVTLNSSPDGLKRRPQKTSFPVSPEQPGRNGHHGGGQGRLRHRWRRRLRDGAPPGTRTVGRLLQVGIIRSFSFKIARQIFELSVGYTSSTESVKRQAPRKQWWNVLLHCWNTHTAAIVGNWEKLFWQTLYSKYIWLFSEEDLARRESWSSFLPPEWRTRRRPWWWGPPPKRWGRPWWWRSGTPQGGPFGGIETWNAAVLSQCGC